MTRSEGGGEMDGVATLLLHGDPGSAAALLQEVPRQDRIDFYRSLGSRPEALLRLAQCWFGLGCWEDAEACLQECLRIRPGDPTCLANLAQVLIQARIHGEAAGILQGLAASHDEPQLHQALGLAQFMMGETVAGLERLRRTLDRDSPWIQRGSYLGHLRSRADFTPAAILRETQRLLPVQWQQWTDPASLFPRGVDRDRRLRVGYLGGHFRLHAAARWTEGLLQSHDRDRFEIFGITQLEQSDQVTERFRKLADGWLDAGGADDDELCAQVRELELDLLVDLSGLWPEGRPGVFARRAAPIQVALTLDYEGTRGIPNLDARLSDEVSDPVGEADAHSTERILRLPNPKSAILPPDPAPEVQPLPVLGGAPFTFGCLHSPERISPGFVDVLAAILRRAPESRLALLWLTEKDRAYRAYREEQFRQRGVRPDRLVFVPRLEHARFLEGFRDLDLGLAPFPVIGGTGCFDSLWMGVPVVVLDLPEAPRHGGRNFLRMAGLEGWCASSPEAYIQLALSWMARPAELGALRGELRGLVRGSELCDASRATRTLEACYRSLWIDWCEGRFPYWGQSPVR